MAAPPGGARNTLYDTQSSGKGARSGANILQSALVGVGSPPSGRLRPRDASPPPGALERPRTLEFAAFKRTHLCGAGIGVSPEHEHGIAQVAAVALGGAGAAALGASAQLAAAGAGAVALGSSGAGAVGAAAAGGDASGNEGGGTADAVMALIALAGDAGVGGGAPLGAGAGAGGVDIGDGGVGGGGGGGGGGAGDGVGGQAPPAALFVEPNLRCKSPGCMEKGTQYLRGFALLKHAVKLQVLTGVKGAGGELLLDNPLWRDRKGTVQQPLSAHFLDLVHELGMNARTYSCEKHVYAGLDALVVKWTSVLKLPVVGNEKNSSGDGGDDESTQDLVSLRDCFLNEKWRLSHPRDCKYLTGYTGQQLRGMYTTIIDVMLCWAARQNISVPLPENRFSAFMSTLHLTHRKADLTDVAWAWHFQSTTIARFHSLFFPCLSWLMGGACIFYPSARVMAHLREVDVTSLDAAILVSVRATAVQRAHTHTVVSCSPISLTIALSTSRMSHKAVPKRGRRVTPRRVSDSSRL